VAQAAVPAAVAAAPAAVAAPPPAAPKQGTGTLTEMMQRLPEGKAKSEAAAALERTRAQNNLMQRPESAASGTSAGTADSKPSLNPSESRIEALGRTIKSLKAGPDRDAAIMERRQLILDQTTRLGSRGNAAGPPRGDGGPADESKSQELVDQRPRWKNPGGRRRNTARRRRRTYREPKGLFAF
jgi:hypothetical protein